MVNLNMDGIICNMATVEASQRMLRPAADLGLSEGGLWTPPGRRPPPPENLDKIELRNVYKGVFLLNVFQIIHSVNHFILVKYIVNITNTVLKHKHV